MPRSKKSTIKATASHKKSRKLQLANARKQRKVNQNVVNMTDISECRPAKQQHVPFPRKDCVVPSSSSQSCGSDSLPADKTRSQLKIDATEDMTPSSSKRVSVDEGGHTKLERRGIVDLPELGEIIKMLCCPQCKNTSLVFNTGGKKAQGLAVHAEVYCSCCEEIVTGRYLASRSDDGDRSFAINKQFVHSALDCGMDVTSLNTFCDNMNLPGVHHKTFHNQAKKYLKSEDPADMSSLK